MKALIKVGHGCNENCTFCHTADLRHLGDSAERITQKITRARRLGYTMVVLSGGSPRSGPSSSAGRATSPPLGSILAW